MMKTPDGRCIYSICSTASQSPDQYFNRQWGLRVTMGKSRPKRANTLRGVYCKNGFLKILYAQEDQLCCTENSYVTSYQLFLSVTSKIPMDVRHRTHSAIDSQNFSKEITWHVHGHHGSWDTVVRHWRLKTCIAVNFVDFSVIHVSQGSVATYIRCDGMSTQRCIAHFLLSLSVK